MYIILAIIAFGILIVTHELGHFLVAKACGVKVQEFSLGMGPQLLKKQGKETLYSLRLLPIGGFCAMEGEDESSDDPRAFTAQPPWKRILILVAGAASNFLVGFLLVLLVFSQSVGYSSPRINAFMDGCPYEGESMLMEGDTFYKVDGHRTYFANNVSEYMKRSGSDYHDIVVVRNGQKIKLDNFYMPLLEYTQDDGSTVMKYGFYFTIEMNSAGAAIKNSWYCCLDFVRLIWRSLGDLVVDVVNQVASEQESVSDALLNVAYMFALIAVNLAVMNMLPIPALDGGRVFFLLVTWILEKILRRKIDPKYEGYIHTAGFVLLMVLMVFVMFNDVIKIIFNR
jgi:regulator of sigma E protease